MNKLLIALLGVFASSSAFAAWDYECHFGGGPKQETRCTAKGVIRTILVKPSIMVAPAPNTLEVKCNNGFSLNDATAQAALFGPDLNLEGIENNAKATILMKDFDQQGGEFDSTLTITVDQQSRHPLRGTCDVDFTSS